MKRYLSVFRLRVKLETQYRAAALGGLVTQLFFGIILLCLYRTLYDAAGQESALAATASYVWIQQAFFRLLLSNNSEVTGVILKGDMVYHLIRPVDPYAFWYTRIAAAKLSGSLLRAIPLLLIALLLPPSLRLHPPASPAGLALAFFTLLLGLLACAALDTLSCGIVLRTLDNRGVAGILSAITMFLSGNLLPLTLFPDRWQRALTLLPFAQILDAPIRLYTGLSPLGDAPRVIAVQLFWTLALVALGRLVWQRNLRRIVVQGG